MVEQDQSVNAGDQVSNAPVSGLPLTPEAQFRNVNTRLDSLADQISRLAKPPKVRISEILQIGVFVIAIIVAIFTASSLGSRIDDLNKSQAASELRVSSNLTATEGRLGGKLDKLGDQFTRVDERTAHLEGRLAANENNRRH